MTQQPKTARRTASTKAANEAPSAAQADSSAVATQAGVPSQPIAESKPAAAKPAADKPAAAKPAAAKPAAAKPTPAKSAVAKPAPAASAPNKASAEKAATVKAAPEKTAAAPAKPKAAAAQPSPAPARPSAKPASGGESPPEKAATTASPAPATHAPSPASHAPAPPKAAEKSAAPRPTAVETPDFDSLAHNMARLVEEGGKAVAAFVEARENGDAKSQMSEEVEQAVKSVGRVAEYWMADPVRTVRAQTALTGQFIDLWATTLRRFYGEEAPPVAAPPPGDKRFADKEWSANPVFDFLRQAYVITSNWANDLAADAEALDPHTREKAQFYVRQITSALSPTNFLATNPELIRETFVQSGENLVRGMKMLAEDIRAGRGSLKIRQSDGSKFQLGVNMANTPGKVVYRNELMELIQYEPTTPSVYKRPLLIVPPWINKFYILDLNAEKSFIRWAVSQGLTVFTISWVNPDERQAEKDFAAYMREGIFAALDAMKEITGEEKATAIGYCVGGTLLSVALAFMAAKGDNRIDSATLFTTQVDFRDPGELRIFVDEEQIHAIEMRMEERGYLDGSKMASAFNMLRPNDLIWSYWVNNYLKGKEPMPFDLLVWNSDSTRMPKANHSYYLRNCYLENNLTQGRMVLEDVKLDLSKVKIPIYDLAAKEDHIAPAKSVFIGAQYFGGPVKYVLAGSGHIAGVVNPANKPKYQFWTGPAPSGAFEDWVAKATETPGSWWPDWIKWIEAQAPERVPARSPGSKKHPPIADAPGEYVRVKA